MSELTRHLATEHGFSGEDMPEAVRSGVADLDHFHYWLHRHSKPAHRHGVESGRSA